MNEKIDRDSNKPQEISNTDLEKFIKNTPSILIVDRYKDLLEDLFLLRNPKMRFDQNADRKFEEYYKKYEEGTDAIGSWFYFSWTNTLVHFLSETEHNELRTGRNKNLITEAEQDKYYNSSIAIFGMSVGSHVAITIAMTGGAKNITLADPDNLSGDNLNRIRNGFHDVGMNKAINVARKLYEINPYCNLTLHQDGLNENNFNSIVQSHNLLIDEMDNPYWKIKIREEVKKYGVPIIMGTDNGDGIIVDIERFDLDKEYPILHGLTGSLTAQELKKLNPRDLPKIAAKIAGANLASLRMLDSVTQVGKTLYSWPQLGTAATLCGATLAYIARRIILKDKLIESGRYEVNLDSIFESGYNTENAIKIRKTKRDKIIQLLQTQ